MSLREDADINIASERKALVTGGASGIGLEVARRLVSQGTGVALLDIDKSRLEAAASEVGGKVLLAPADVRSPSEVRQAVERAAGGLGGLDTLVICAGIIHVKPVGEVSEADWDRTLDINLKGAFLCCQAAAPALTASGRGRIVVISSDAGKRGVPLLLAYSASKFGLIGLAEALAAELAPAVTVNCVCPVGVATTGMGRQLLAWKTARARQSADEVLSDIAGRIPLRRNCSAADVAEAVLFFISESADFLTGVALDVDGGARLNTLPGADE
jgi:meso-butanediol dehydrogenase / (S,S)-butanediol dehydrogenase / diacetyl reductase